MKKILLSIILILLLIPVTTFGKEGELKPQTICPVMGGKIQKNVYLDHQGQRVYFCCGGCKKVFLENPEKYMKKIGEDKVLLESVQKKCPVMGGDIDKKVYTDHKGRRVYFCCESCKKPFEQDPEKYLKKVK
ncbi:MAG: YHS domain-containing protein [Thermodesulfobacteriota bacterium]|nr:YHS domain-containing protein [Thermodesulfobacteriota bacterium]